MRRFTTAFQATVGVALVVYAATISSAAEGEMQIDKARRTISLSCRVAPRKLPNLSEVYPLEVICTAPAPKGQKAHETVVTFAGKPSAVQAALVELGLKPGKPAKGEGTKAEGPEVEVVLEWTKDSSTVRSPLEKLIIDRKSGKPMPKLKWLFTGSVMKQIDPEKPEKVFAADETGTLIAIFPVTDEVVFQSNLTLKEEKLIKLETNTKLLPAEGTDVTLVITAK